MAVANMLESQLASRPAPPPVLTGNPVLTGPPVLTGTTGGVGERLLEDHVVAPQQAGPGLCAPVDPDAGARAHRVHRPPVRPDGRGGGTGLGPRRSRRGGRRPGHLRPVRVGPGRVPRDRLPGLP